MQWRSLRITDVVLAMLGLRWRIVIWMIPVR